MVRGVIVIVIVIILFFVGAVTCSEGVCVVTYALVVDVLEGHCDAGREGRYLCRNEMSGNDGDRKSRGTD